MCVCVWSFWGRHPKCVCVYVCARARVCVCACVCVCVCGPWFIPHLWCSGCCLVVRLRTSYPEWLSSSLALGLARAILHSLALAAPFSPVPSRYCRSSACGGLCLAFPILCLCPPFSAFAVLDLPSFHPSPPLVFVCMFGVSVSGPLPVSLRPSSFPCVLATVPVWFSFGVLAVPVSVVSGLPASPMLRASPTGILHMPPWLPRPSFPQPQCGCGLDFPWPPGRSC